MTTKPPTTEEALVTIGTPASDTVRVRDRVESSRFEFYFDADVSLTGASTDEIYFPVDVAARIPEVSSITIPSESSVILRRGETGAVIAQNDKNQAEAGFPREYYEIELLSSPMKLYLSVTSSLEIVREHRSVRLLLDDGVDVVLGARSHHEQPAGTVTTDGSIESVMDAVSTFGSALKTTSVERSWPTLRGYPPRIEVGDEHHIPPAIRPPDTDIFIQVPRTLESVFKVAPLAYYLAATVEPLPPDVTTPRIVAAGEVHELSGDLSVGAVEQLQRTLLLDCITRTEGLYSMPINERDVIEGDLPWDPATVYDQSLAVRFNSYQEVPDAVLDEIRPTWPLTIDVMPDEAAISSLPHLAEELALVRTPAESVSDPKPTPGFVDEFIRADGSGTVRSSPSTAGDDFSVATPEPWQTQIHSTLLPEYPLGSNKTTSRAYERHIERQAPENEAIEVRVVCNADQMREEEIVTELYGVRDLLEFDVEIHQNLDRAAFEDLLAESFDLLHYIGHIDESGILCSDGYLDVRTDVDEVGIEAFILNACRSVPQGEALLDLGAIGGVATLFDVPNSSATAVGRNLSRLLNRGFPIRAALEIARESSVLGRRWVSCGDGRVSLTQSESGMPSLMNITPLDNDRFELELEWFETPSHRIGSMMKPNTEWGEYHVMPSRTKRILSGPELDELFSLEVSPVRCDGTVTWTDEVSPDELRRN